MQENPYYFFNGTSPTKIIEFGQGTSLNRSSSLKSFKGVLNAEKRVQNSRALSLQIFNGNANAQAKVITYTKELSALRLKRNPSPENQQRMQTLIKERNLLIPQKHTNIMNAIAARLHRDTPSEWEGFESSGTQYGDSYSKENGNPTKHKSVVKLNSHHLYANANSTNGKLPENPYEILGKQSSPASKSNIGTLQTEPVYAKALSKNARNLVRQIQTQHNTPLNVGYNFKFNNYNV